MKKPSTRKNYNLGNPEPRYNLNNNSPKMQESKSFNDDNIPLKKQENLNFNTYNISSQNPNSRLINIEKYNNIRPITQTRKSPDSNYLHCPSCFCPNSHYHIHHFHIPHTYTHICPRLTKLENAQLNEDLLKEIAELKKECKKFRDELEKTKSENELGNKYIKLLENKISSKQYDVKEEEMLGSKYHSMLDKSFEVLNSVSNKCDDEKGKLKGNVYYYTTKEPDYDSLIEAQKRWLDNLPEKYTRSNYNNNNMFNNYNNSTFSNTNDKFREFDASNSHFNEKYFNNMRNFNKTSDNNIINNNIKDNTDIIIKKNQNTYPEFHLNNNDNNINEPNNNNFGMNIAENKEPDLEEQIPQEEMDNEQEEMENIEQQNLNNNNEMNKESSEEEENPLNERYLITDKDGNPIIIGGQALLGMKLIPLIGEDGKEELDENGNIILIGPDGKPKSQDELEPILLDNDKPLVNEENRPLLGINGIPLINELGSPILGPGELYDRNNKVVKGVLGILQKDNFGNPKKILINQNKPLLNNNNDINDEIIEEEMNENSENKIDNNNNEINNDIENDINNNDKIDIDKIRPLIGANGLPVRDSENNFVFLDENNKPVKNTGLYLLLDQIGKPVLNAKSKPILINSEGKPINLIDNDKNNDFINNQLINSITNNINNNKIPQNKESDDNSNKKGEIKYPKLKPKKIEKKRPSNKNNNRYNKILMNESQNLRDKRNKGQFTYSEVSSDEFKKVQFMKNSLEYKGNCFACDVGCSVSRSGYSPMNYVPYNNMIRRREVTPVKRIRKKAYDGQNNIRVNKTDIEDDNDNNYYLTEE